MNRPVVATAVVALVAAASFLSPRRAPAADKEYKVIPTANCGSIHGFVKLKAKVARGSVSVFKDNDKGCGEKDHKTERLEFDEATLGLGNALVFLKGVEAGKDWPEAMKSDDRTVTIDQKGCQYVPHVQWARPGTQAVILNSDRADHNIHGYKATLEKSSFENTKFNFASEPGTKKSDIGDAYLEDIAKYIVKCDIHPWMNAYVHVVDNPYCVLTGATEAGGLKPGEFLLTDVPAGKYTLLVWKEGAKETAQETDGKISAYNYGPDVVVPVEVTVEAGKAFEVADVLLDCAAN